MDRNTKIAFGVMGYAIVNLAYGLAEMRNRLVQVERKTKTLIDLHVQNAFDGQFSQIVEHFDD